ncbi:uncharacterized protein LOC115224477 [Octopus sinensis]|uniref:ATP-dependent DNA helicase n=1 Tax=Octopus sinensis TaxID=2607531 RepID=A0A7E6FR15_9MOLL|nr:uncharacterized protein LOC115224477 [Octopus sinensis]
MDELIKKCDLIVWDECTLAHTRALQAVDRTLRDIRNNNSQMGKATVLLTGDFCQTLPVVPEATKMDEVNAPIKSSALWHHMQTFHLSTNMRAQLSGDRSVEEFAEILLRLGEGRTVTDEDEYLELDTICNLIDSVEDLVSKVFPDLLSYYQNADWICEPAIMVPQNATIKSINPKLLNAFPGEMVTYNSIVTVIDEEEIVNYPVRVFELTGATRNTSLSSAEKRSSYHVSM